MPVTSGRRNPGRVRAVVYAVLVHAVVIGLLVIGFRWSIKPSGEKIVQAVAVPESARRKPEVPDKRALEQEAARKKAEAEKAQQAELKKKQDAVALKQKQEQADLLRQKAERQKQEAARKQKEQAEQQKRAAAVQRQNEEKRQQKQAVQSLQDQLAAEEKARQAAAQAARAATVVDKYKALIRQRVSRSWSRPLGVAKGLQCVVSVSLTPSGEVLAATVVRSSGNSSFDRSVENAVYKAAPLPLPDDPTLFDNFREIEFLFNPEG
ncbi:MAG: cell envelope integrity protein TolA [Sulfuricaulis sp.]